MKVSSRVAPWGTGDVCVSIDLGKKRTRVRLQFEEKGRCTYRPAFKALPISVPS